MALVVTSEAKRAALAAWAEEHEVTLVFFDGLDDAILGITYRFGQEPVVLYDRSRCVEILIERDGMLPDEAEEFFCVNTEGLWVGKETPAFLIAVPGMDMGFDILTSADGRLPAEGS